MVCHIISDIISRTISALNKRRIIIFTIIPNKYLFIIVKYVYFFGLLAKRKFNGNENDKCGFLT